MWVALKRWSILSVIVQWMALAGIQEGRIVWRYLEVVQQSLGNLAFAPRSHRPERAGVAGTEMDLLLPPTGRMRVKDARPAEGVNRTAKTCSGFLCYIHWVLRSCWTLIQPPYLRQGRRLSFSYSFSLAVGLNICSYFHRRTREKAVTEFGASYRFNRI